jgi:hypothetical protein
MGLDIDLIDAGVMAWHETLVKGQKIPGQIWFNSNSQPSGSTTVVLHKHTEERMENMREVPGMLQRSDKGGDKKKRRDLGMDLRGVWLKL